MVFLCKEIWRTAAHVLVFAAMLNCASSTSLDKEWNEEIQPVFERFCYDCHGDTMDKGELNLDRFVDIASMKDERDVWSKIKQHVDLQLMPPLDEEQPSSESRGKISSWIERALFIIDPEKPNPGRTTLRRLNRVEYENSVNDLLQTNLDLKEFLPPDDTGYGYDTVGDILTISPAHIDKYLAIAEMTLDRAIRTTPMPYPSKKVTFTRQIGNVGKTKKNEYIFTTNSRINTDLTLPKGEYEIQIEASGDIGNQVAPVMEFSINDISQKRFSVTNPRSHADFVTYRHRFKALSHRSYLFSLSFINDFYDPSLPPSLGSDRNLSISKVSLVGPLDGERKSLPKSHRYLVKDKKPAEDHNTYFQRIIPPFLSKAFRRPADKDEIVRYTSLAMRSFTENSSLEEALKTFYSAVLISPEFLFHRKESEQFNDDMNKLTAYTLASRLSYFLWSTMPDDELLQEAANNTLHENLEQQVDRLLSSPKSQQFIKNFFGQWLQLRDLPHLTVSSEVFPKFNNALQSDMQYETELLISEMIQHNLPVTFLLDATHTYLNERLAKHYGIESIKGEQFRKVNISSSLRHGILGHGSVHLLTSHPDRTSPVLRGKYILENLLDREPPPPPQNVDQLNTSEQSKEKSFREQLITHRKEPLCAGCHNLMDPIGFALETFDATGKLRTSYNNGLVIDSSGKLFNNNSFSGLDELRTLLIDEHKNTYTRSVIKNMLTYSLGRGIQWYDKPVIDSILNETQKGNYAIHTLIKSLVRSVPFQYEKK